jgi:hypothetical protein
MTDSTETDKPLWMQICEMPEAEAKAQMADDVRRWQAGEMSQKERDDHLAAWERVTNYHASYWRARDRQRLVWAWWS